MDAEQQRSPVLRLKNAIAGAAFRIAPEKEEELAEFRDAHGVSLALEDGSGFRFNVKLTSREVSTNVATLEYLWASAHAHLVLYDEYCKAQRSGLVHFDTGSNPRTHAALELLNWSVRNLADAGNAAWPSHLPAPVQFPTPGTDVHVANELFLCAVAWILHHEIAHLRLGHPAIQSNRSLIEEQEADREATMWILADSVVTQESRKRTVGIAAAILALQGIHKATDFTICDTHPGTFERIDACLTAAQVSDDDEVYAFAACVMQIQLAARGVLLAADGGSFKEVFSEYLIAFATQGRNSS
jgi:hypothetical protein